MATFSDKMTAINNEIRTMTNTTAPLGLDAMKEHLADANEEISEQDALVEQLISSMSGKSVPGGGSGGAGVETCTLKVNTVHDSNIDPFPPHFTEVVALRYYNGEYAQYRLIYSDNGTFYIYKNGSIVLDGDLPVDAYGITATALIVSGQYKGLSSATFTDCAYPCIASVYSPNSTNMPPAISVGNMVCFPSIHDEVIFTVRN